MLPGCVPRAVGGQGAAVVLWQEEGRGSGRRCFVLFSRLEFFRCKNNQPSTNPSSPTDSTVLTATANLKQLNGKHTGCCGTHIQVDTSQK